METISAAWKVLWSWPKGNRTHCTWSIIAVTLGFLLWKAEYFYAECGEKKTNDWGNELCIPGLMLELDSLLSTLFLSLRVWAHYSFGHLPRFSFKPHLKWGQIIFNWLLT